MRKAQSTEHKTQIKTQVQVENTKSTNKYRELEERTHKFARECRDFIKQLPKTVSNVEYGRQLIRSSGSQAANYIEANESLGKKDFVMRIKICRKEAKESCLWLKLSEPLDSEDIIRRNLLQEAEELRKIFSSILNKSL